MNSREIIDKAIQVKRGVWMSIWPSNEKTLSQSEDSKLRAVVVVGS